MATVAAISLEESLMEDLDAYKFKTADWVVFVLMLVVSVLIGVVSALRDRKKATIQDYLIGGGNMPPLAVALSLMGGWISAISILGNPTEIYFYGTQLSIALIGCIPGAMWVNKLMLPIFYNLKIVSLSEYLELRYHSTVVRKVGSFVSLLNLFLYMGMCLYAPSLALSTVTSLSTFASMAIMGAIVTFYITIGGVKAVVYTDVLQTLLMFGGVLAVVVMCCIELGGIGEVWAIAERGDRLEFFNMNPSIYERHTFLSTLCMGFFLVINSIGISQSSYQRFASVSTLKTARGLVYFFLAGLWCLWILFFFSGLVAYATYSTCDPLTSGKINKPDQILPFLVTDKLGHIPALSGLFVAAVYGGVLSTLSSCGNSAACMVWEDFLKPLPFFSKLSDKSATLVVKILSSFTGVLSVVLGLVMGSLGNIFHVLFSISSCLNGPLSGLFLTGILLPGGMLRFSKLKNLLVHEFPHDALRKVQEGLLAALTFNVWMVVGNFVTGGGSPARLPLSVAGCASSMNATLDVLASTTLDSTTLDSTTVDQTEKSLYNISYCFNSLIGIGIAMLVSNVAMLALSPNNPKEVKGGVVNPTCERLYEWAWQRYQVGRKGRTNQDTTSPESYVEAMKMLNQVKADAGTPDNPSDSRQGRSLGRQ
ncbi:Sodium-coupled monocarboxylate transporter 2 [Chionoecetes opilio]|uniref:Sodium-coupled monocarboxylate transporter 2 n=1 Tax=Chionoecetes opilio TaxID=41210 RepID=A0A8J4XSB9_CHIOP|nr:Sodium-coupled monocarboxylate transporter 2 [Chionoecetes opilio]